MTYTDYNLIQMVLSEKPNKTVEIHENQMAWSRRQDLQDQRQINTH